MWVLGGKLATTHWWKWPEQMVGIRKGFLSGMKSFVFGMFQLSSDSFAILRRARIAIVVAMNRCTHTYINSSILLPTMSSMGMPNLFFTNVLTIRDDQVLFNQWSCSVIVSSENTVKQLLIPYHIKGCIWSMYLFIFMLLWTCI